MPFVRSYAFVIHTTRTLRHKKLPMDRNFNSNALLLLLLLLIGILFNVALGESENRNDSNDAAPEDADRLLQQQRRRPNVLFVLTDQQRFDAMSFAGQNKILHTPNIDRLAREGVWFKNAYTTAPVCEPARTSILTGLTIENTQVQINNKPGRRNMVSYDMYLAREGYVAEYYGKWHAPHYLTRPYQNHVDLQTFNLFGPFRRFLARRGYQFLPKGDYRGGLVQESMSGQPYRPNPIDQRFKSHTIPARGVCECDQHGVSTIKRQHTLTAFEGGRTMLALRRLSKLKRPFSLHVSFNSPHGPHVVSEPFASMFNATDMPVPASIGDDLTDSPYKGRRQKPVYSNPHLIGYMTAVYYAQVKEVDMWLGGILKEMDKLGIVNNTMVIFTSDHGEMLGSHGMIEKNVLYEESAHVPLIIRYPNGVPAGRRIGDPVNLRDLFATILDYTGSKPQFSEGSSLRPIIERRQKGVTYSVVESGKEKQLMIRAGMLKLILPTQVNDSALPAMYNLKDDSHEMTNLIGPRYLNRGKHLPLARYLKTLLLQWCSRVNSPHLEQIRARQIG